MAEEILTGLTGSPANDTTTITPISSPAPEATTATIAPPMGLPKVETPKVEAPALVIHKSAF